MATDLGLFYLAPEASETNLSTSSAASPIPTGDPTTLTSRIVNLTAHFTASLLGQIAAYAGAVTAAVLAFQKLNEPLSGIPPWVRAGIIFAPVILALALHTIPALLAERRVYRLKEIRGDLKPRYFSLAPR